MNLKDKVAIITGGNSGIGMAIVLELARQGASIVIDYVAHPEATEALEKQVAALGDHVIGVKADVSQFAELQNLFATAVREFGRVDIMVNNAGVETRTSILDTTEEQYDKVLSINLKSAFFGTQLAALQMIKQGGGGRIINLTSVHEDWPMPGNTAYCLSKGGMRMLTRTAGVELASHNILESKSAPGALIASLAIPWGFSQGDNDQGGYHLVWGRDMVETAGGLLAAGAHGDVRRVLSYLQRTQQADGHWSQNMWLPGADGSHLQQQVRVKNVVASENTQRASHLISPDALALVRFGLRAADDPRIRDTTNVIDALLKIETPTGPTWHRYNDDGYGEHEDGSPFDGTGIGRGWPLITGERAHFELAAGRVEVAKQLLATMESFANESGLISEQVWDSPDLPEHELQLGQPSGSAMPLVWAHAEYIKLQRSLRDGRLFDQPSQTVQRYLKDRTGSPRLIWRFNHKLRSLPPGKILRIELMASAIIRWTTDDWKTYHDEKTRDAGLGIHLADLATQEMSEGKQVKFTFHWPDAGHWEDKNFMVPVAAWCRNDFILAKENHTHGKSI